LDTGLELATLRIGLVGFVDVGWVGRDSELGRPYTGTGVGLRIGSRPLLGDGVFRIDLAKPLDEVPGEASGWQVSLTVGQVFTFGGNTTVAGSR
jgi:outer membrane translocation and assembly module TamA